MVCMGRRSMWKEEDGVVYAFDGFVVITLSPYAVWKFFVPSWACILEWKTKRQCDLSCFRTRIGRSRDELPRSPKASERLHRHFFLITSSYIPSALCSLLCLLVCSSSLVLLFCSFFIRLRFIHQNMYLQSSFFFLHLFVCLVCWFVRSDFMSLVAFYW